MTNPATDAQPRAARYDRGGRGVVVGDEARPTAATAGLLCLRSNDGSVVSDEGWRWLGTPGDEDERLLDLAVAPVLDIGCGPGRHLRALAGRGVDALGLDVTPSVVRLARAQGVKVLEGSIFGPVPASGTWGSALLLDGNIGIGADPVALLRRVATLLQPGGRILVELDPPGSSSQSRRVRLEHEASSGPWFDWAAVGTTAIAALAAAAGVGFGGSWTAGGRWFARLDTGPRTSSDPRRPSAA